MFSRRIFVLLAVAGVMRAADDPSWISRLGGVVERDRSDNVIVVKLAGRWVNDAEMVDLAALPKLERLDLSHTRISDEGLLHLRPARQIQDLNLLYAEQITDQGMNAIRDWHTLKVLNVRGTRITDSTLAMVAKLTQLESLDIASTAVTENGLAGLIPLTRLKHLALGRNRLNDNALDVLRFLQTLESLDLSGPRGVNRNARRERTTGLAEPLVRAMAELKELRVLKLGDTAVGADELRRLTPALGRVEKLGLEDCSRVNDEALQVLAQWPALKYLDVQETAVTQGGVETLRKAKPGLKILTKMP
jgi:Leucine-rich repeat (LRR) protein